MVPQVCSWGRLGKGGLYAWSSPPSDMQYKPLTAESHSLKERTFLGDRYYTMLSFAVCL
jgi:hypothetical protein